MFKKPIMLPPSVNNLHSPLVAPPAIARRPPNPLNLIIPSMMAPTITLEAQLAESTQRAMNLTAELESLIKDTRRAEERRNEEWTRKMQELDRVILLLQPPPLPQVHASPLADDAHDRAHTDAEGILDIPDTFSQGAITEEPIVTARSSELDIELSEEQIQSTIRNMNVCSTTTEDRPWEKDREASGTYRCQSGGHTLTLEEISVEFKRVSLLETANTSEEKLPEGKEFHDLLRELSHCPDAGDFIKREWGYICKGGGHVVKNDRLRKAILQREQDVVLGDGALTPTPASALRCGSVDEVDPVSDTVPSTSDPSSHSDLSGGTPPDPAVRIQLRIQQMSRCGIDRPWVKDDDGYRCEGGEHHVSDAELTLSG